MGHFKKKEKKMKRKILILLILTIFIKSYGQKVDIINTKDLLSISKSEGLTTAIEKVDFMPIHYIDRRTTVELINQTLNQPYSYDNEHFLTNFSNFNALPELTKPLNSLIRKRISFAEKDTVGGYGEVNTDLMNALLSYNDKETELILIDYYKTWLKLAKKNRKDYLQGKSDSIKYIDSTFNTAISNRIYDLMKPYKDCNYNCYLIMLTLQKMKSVFPEKKKLEYHRKIGEVIDLSNEIKKNEISSIFEDRTPKIIALNRNYDSIKDIDFGNELNFYNSYIHKLNSEFEIYGFYNQKSGIISICQDNECYYYIIKLIDKNKLQVHKTIIYTTTSS
jgi:hypothetical protein